MTKKNSTCTNCQKDFVFEDKRSTGKFCSTGCHHDYRSRTQWIPAFERGEISDSKNLKKHVVARDGDECAECELTDWLGKPIILDLDHIDGNPTNNMPDNLRLLCPNCHRQTKTWGNQQSRIDTGIAGRRVLKGGVS